MGQLIEMDCGQSEDSAIFHNSVNELYRMIKAVKPNRFNVGNRDTLFNDVRVTDFAYVNMEKMWKIVKMLKMTKVTYVQTILDYKRDILIIVSPDHAFRYELKQFDTMVN